jgi:hypothetical protein
VIGKGDPLVSQCFNVGRFDQRVTEHGQGVTSPLVYNNQENVFGLFHLFSNLNGVMSFKRSIAY